VRALQELDDAESELAEIKGEPAGPLHVTAPLMFAIHTDLAAPAAFMQPIRESPSTWTCPSRSCDLFQERIDVAVRITDAVDPRLVAFRLRRTGVRFCGVARISRAARHAGHARGPGRAQRLIVRGARLNASWQVQRGTTLENCARERQLRRQPRRSDTGMPPRGPRRE
jgi:hypothetical protein